MKKNTFQPLFLRTAMAALALTLLAFLPPALLAIKTLRASIEEQAEENGGVAAAALAAAARQAVSGRQQAVLQALVQEVQSTSGVGVAFVVDPEGRIWAHSDPERLGEKYSPEVHGSGYFDGVAAVGPAQRPLAFAHVGLPRSDFDARLAAFRNSLLVAFCAIALAALLLGAVLAAWQARVLDRLARIVKEMAAGDLKDAPWLARAPAELKELAHGIGRLWDSVSFRVKGLQETTEQLDRRLQDLSLVCSVGEAMNRGDDSQGLLETIVASAADGIGAEVGAVLLAGDRDGEVRAAVSRGLGPDSETNPWYRLVHDSAIAVIEEGASLTWQPPETPAGDNSPDSAMPVVAAAETDSPPPERAEAPDDGSGARSGRYVVGVPLRVGRQVAGALLVAGNGRLPDREGTELVEALAVQAARCVDQGRLYTASMTDGLTGLLVSRYFRTRLREELRSAVRYHRQTSLLLLDIDNFGNLNETLGRTTGEAVLQVVAGCVVKTLRDEVDLAARWGGDEFAVLLPETGREGAKVVAERLRDLVRRQPMEVEGSTFQVTVCTGIATCPEDGVRPEVLIRRAENALERAKQSGRNRLVVASPDDPLLPPGTGGQGE